MLRQERSISWQLTGGVHGVNSARDMPFLYEMVPCHDSPLGFS